MDWNEAKAWSANLSFTDGVKVYDNWRLPTVEPVNGASFVDITSYDGTTDEGFNITSPQSEMSFMYYVNLGNPGQYTSDGADSGCYVSSNNTCLDNTAPFINLTSGTNIFPGRYWSDTIYAGNPYSGAWTFHMAIGRQTVGAQGNLYYAWAVTPGDVAAIPEANVWTMLLAGLGLVGVAAGRRRHH